MIQIVKEFTVFADKVGEYINNSNYKTKYFIETLKLSKPTFYRKLRENAFTVAELNIIAELLYPQDFYEWKLKQSIKKGREDYKNGNIIDAKEDLKQLRKEFQNQ